MNEIFELLKKELSQSKVEQNVVLKPYSTFKMGGPAEYYVAVEDEDELVKAIRVAHKLKLPLRVLGGASNIVISDTGIKGLVIRNITSQKKILNEDADSVLMHISSGYPMTRLAKETAASGYSGFEHHLGLPGTLGGALFMNSKWVDPDHTYYVGDALERAMIIEKTGDTKIVDKAYFEFGYDYSVLQKTGEIVVWAEYRLLKVDANSLIEAGKKLLAYRHRTQPHGVMTSGCFFKNVAGESAGKLIDQAGLKGYKVGGAYVSDMHANFILNDGSASTQDVHKLLADIKQRVKKYHNVDLEQEVDVI